MSSININSGTNIGRAGPSAGQSSNAQSTAPSTPSITPGSAQVSYQNSSNLSTMNLLTERMFSNTATLNAMDVRQLSILIRELLSMPREIQQLLAMLAFGDQNSAAQLAQMLKNPDIQILLKDLQSLIGQNSKDVINKLIQLTQNNALFFEGSSQLRNIMGLIQNVAQSVQASPAEALTMALVLYLPWLPLMEQKKLDLTFGFLEEEDENGDDSQCEVLILFINTDHLGTFKITILLHADKTLDIMIEADKAASDHLQKLVKDINEHISTSGVKSKIATTTRKVPEKKTPKEMKSDTNKSISLHPSGKISAITVNAGYKIAKAIFTIDEKVELLATREEKVK